MMPSIFAWFYTKWIKHIRLHKIFYVINDNVSSVNKVLQHWSQVHTPHYGGIVCLSCRAFFRRTYQASPQPQFFCRYDHKCTVTVKNRRRCQKCRLGTNSAKLIFPLRNCRKITARFWHKIWVCTCIFALSIWSYPVATYRYGICK